MGPGAEYSVEMARFVLLLSACRSPASGFVDDVLGDCTGTFRDPDPYPNQLEAGTDLSRLTLDAPEALCNDGTPAVLYVRAGSDDWVMHLQGGGTCNSFEDCEERWCGAGYHDASKMSSAWAPAHVAGLGLASADSESRFAAATQVFFYYCTSDAWSGRSSTRFTADDGRSMWVHRDGHAILEAAFALLREPRWSDDGHQKLPDLDDARSLLFSGTSGGSAGAQINLDWVREQIEPSTPVFGVFDASFTPRPELLPTGPGKRLRDRDTGIIGEIAGGSVFPPFADESCRAALADTEDEWICQDPTWFAYDHVTTPFLARQDLYDSNVIDSYLKAGMSEIGFAKAVRSSLLSLAALPATAAEGAAMTRTPSAYGPACGQHVGLESDTWFFDATVVADGGPVSLHDAAYAAMSGETLSIVDALDGRASQCPDLEAAR